ncbi:hypothetical protein RMATCC62417_13428 [Rhizopus microsporus]|nr:hypothetical protein RMATCC62417_13428 [Rhizopus microsporus]
MTVTSEQLPSQLEKHHDTSMATIGSGKGIPTTVYEETNTMDLDAQKDFNSRPNGGQQSSGNIFSSGYHREIPNTINSCAKLGR